MYLTESILIFGFLLAVVLTLRHFGKAFYDLYAIMDLAHNLYYKTLLEATPPEGQTTRERILNILKRKYALDSDYINRNPNLVKMDYKTSSGYSFDLYLHEKQSLLNKITSRYGDEGLDVFVKIFDAIVSLEDLKNLHNALLKIYNRQWGFRKKVFDTVIALSPKGFTGEAIEYAKKGESWIPEIRLKKGAEIASIEEYIKKSEDLEIEFICAIDLIKETKKGFKLIWSYERPLSDLDVN
jgi:hypothetical protein